MQGTQQQPVEQSNTWQRAAEFGRSFLSLGWYDESIDFLFKFVAKTSEPLLAAGLVVSAADFLSDGLVMKNNPGLALTWSWTQAIAIETSAGVTLVYAFQSIRGRDKAKVWIYSILALLLALVGMTMLFLQLMAHSLGIGETHITSSFAWLPFVMSALRSIVAVGYVVMCRTKNINFTNKGEDVPTPAHGVPSISQEQLNEQLTQFQTSITDAVRGMLDEHMRLTMPMTRVSEANSPNAGTSYQIREHDTPPELLATGTANNQFISIPQTGAIQARQKLEDAWLTLTTEEQRAITGNEFYERVGRGMRKQFATDFVKEMQANLQREEVSSPTTWDSAPQPWAKPEQSSLGGGIQKQKPDAKQRWQSEQEVPA